MLAKVPSKLKSDKSSFIKLVQYMTQREKEKEHADDELDPSDRQRHIEILANAGGHLRTAEDHLQATRRVDAFDAAAIRIRLECTPHTLGPYGPGYGGVDDRVENTVDGGVDDDPYRRSISRSRQNINAAESYLGQVAKLDPDFQIRARTRRANLAFNVEAAARRHGRYLYDIGDDEFEYLDLVGDAQRLITSSGVVCQHNCLSLATAGAEMTAVAAQNTRVEDPVYHVVISWPSSENPTPDQAFACGEHVLKAVGMAGHQYVFALHRDTSNAHMHIAVNRVSPVNFRAVYPDRDYFKLDHAMRELELRFGWKHDNGPYAVFERNGRMVIDWRSAEPDTKGHLPASAADMERHADQESFFSYVRGEPRSDILTALKNERLSWDDLHLVLRKHGLALREKGQGFAIYELSSAKTTPVKASDMHENMSKSRLLSRLGQFVPFHSEVEAEAPPPAHSYDKFRAPLRNQVQRDDRRQERADARRNLRQRYADYTAQFVTLRLDPTSVKARFYALRDVARRRQAEVRASVPDRAKRKALYSVIAFETVREREHLRVQISQEREALRLQMREMRKPYKAWVEQQAATGDAAAISQLRGWSYAEKRNATALARAGTDQINGFRIDQAVDPLAVNLHEQVIFVVKRDGTVNYTVGREKRAIVDRGAVIELPALRQTGAATLAAIALAKRKFGDAFEVIGNPDFKSLVNGAMSKYATERDLMDALQRAIGDMEHHMPTDRPRRHRAVPKSSGRATRQ